MSDVMVVGYDLATQQHVHLTGANREEHRPRGYGGTEEIICWLCWQGHEAPVGTKVPLVVKGRDGGVRRSHFAHPAGMAPASGHSPETVWHYEAKTVLANWARRQPDVVTVEVERSLADRSRRADVMVTFAGGRQVAIEVQYSQHTDGEWLARHSDYVRAGIVDVWVWSTAWWADISRRVSVPVWTLDPGKERLRTQVAKPHRPGSFVTDADVTRSHWPACPSDENTWKGFALTDCSLDATGIQPPATFHLALERSPHIALRPSGVRPTRVTAYGESQVSGFDGLAISRNMVDRIRREDRERLAGLTPEQLDAERIREAERIKAMYWRHRKPK